MHGKRRTATSTPGAERSYPQSIRPNVPQATVTVTKTLVASSKALAKLPPALSLTPAIPAHTPTTASFRGPARNLGLAPSPICLTLGIPPPTRAGIHPLALEPVCLSPRHSGPRAGIHPLHPRTELDHIMSPNPQSLLLFPSPPVPNQGTRHRSIPNLSSSPPPPGTELGAHSCAKRMSVPLFFSPPLP